MKLVIAEKPEVARDIAGAILTKTCNKNGYMIGEREGETWAVTSAFGHLLELCEPDEYDLRYKSWRLEDLPLMFPNWKMVPAKEPYKRARLQIIGKLLESADEIICAGDPDDEGQLLIDEILDYFQVRKMCWRVFLNDNMPENIRREFGQLKKNDVYRPMGLSAGARRMADKCFGINETRLAGCKLRKSKLAIGRVQTPTLGMCVKRDEQIENHVKEKYYDLFADMDLSRSKILGEFTFKLKPSKEYLKEMGSKVIQDRHFAESVGVYLQEKKSFSITVEEKEKVTPAPFPYNLTLLQAEMNRKYGYSMNQTLEITQSLRSKRAITYNRSDSQYLKEEHYKEAPKVFQRILGGSMLKEYPLDFSIHSACFQDQYVTAHHGIIPQGNHVPLSSLTEQEKHVYLAICQRYAMQFLKPEIKKVSTATCPVKLEEYLHKLERRFEQVLDPGYTAYFQEKKEGKQGEEEKKKQEYLPAGRYTGEVMAVRIEEKESKPPSRYTEGSLAKDMASVAKYVKDPEIRAILKKKDEGKKGENGSIGTVATRGAIVSGLIKRGFLETKGKNVISTSLGRQFYHMLPPEISSPDITAKWWLIQETIKEGKETNPNILQEAVCEEFRRHKDSAYQGLSLGTPEEFGYSVKEKVSGIWKGEEVRFNRVWGGHTFTEEEIQALCRDETICFQGISSRTKRPYKVSGKLERQEYKGVSFVGFQADFAKK